MVRDGVEETDGRSAFIGPLRRGTNVKPEVEAWIAAQRLVAPVRKA